MPRVVHFEIPADDPERSVQFYSEVFGWKGHKWEGPEDYWLLTTGEEAPGINGAIMRRGNGFTAPVNTVDVDSVDTYVDKITAQGGTVVAPKMAVPGIGYLAYCADPAGNMFGIMQTDDSAA